MTIKHSYNTVAKGQRQVALDTETTGLVDARMVSIALVELVDGKPTGKSLYKLVNPEKVMDDFVISIHHITNEMAQAQPLFSTFAKEVRDFIGDSRTVDVHVRWLRQKIEVDPARPVRIVTVRGGGYRFEG